MFIFLRGKLEHERVLCSKFSDSCSSSSDRFVLASIVFKFTVMDDFLEYIIDETIIVISEYHFLQSQLRGSLCKSDPKNFRLEIEFFQRRGLSPL